MIYEKESTAIGEAHSLFQETERNQYVVPAEGGYRVVSYVGYWELYGEEPNDKTYTYKIEKKFD